MAALRDTVALRDVDDTKLHSNRGLQFRSRKFVAVLRREGITRSMGRVDGCGDNAATKSFFALLPKNVLDKQQ